MIQLSYTSKETLYRTVENYIHVSRSYDKPPIYYWYRRVVNAIIAFEADADMSGGHHTDPLQDNLGDVHYFVAFVLGNPVIVIKDFDFNIRTLRSILFPRPTRTINRPSLPIANSPASKIVKSKNIGYKIICSEYADSSIRLTLKGKSTPLNSQFDRLLKPFARRKDGIYAIGEKDGVQYKLFANDTMHPLKEQKNKNVIRLTESQFHKMLVECISKIMKKIV